MDYSARLTCRSLQRCPCHDPLMIFDGTFAAQAISQRGNVRKKQGHAWHGKLETWLPGLIRAPSPAKIIFGPVFWVCWKRGHSRIRGSIIMFLVKICQKDQFRCTTHLLQIHLADDFDNFASSTKLMIPVAFFCGWVGTPDLSYADVMDEWKL